jgi:hypothetical protein
VRKGTGYTYDEEYVGATTGFCNVCKTRKGADDIVSGKHFLHYDMLGFNQKVIVNGVKTTVPLLVCRDCWDEKEAVIYKQAKGLEELLFSNEYIKNAIHYKN